MPDHSFSVLADDGATKPACVPEGIRVYAIGDIHGRDDLLAELSVKINEDAKSMPPGMTRVIVYLGDYVDRGPSSKGVIERLIQQAKELSQDGAEVIQLLGNHEQMMLDFLTELPGDEIWLRAGGEQTILSYGLRPKSGSVQAENPEELRQEMNRLVPGSHKQFLHQLRLAYQLGDFVFVHAGVNPEVSLEAQYANDLLWIRSPFLNSEADFGYIVVHGHSIDHKPQIRSNRLGIDTGAFATNVLTCAVIEGDKVRFLTAGDAHVAGEGRV